MYDALSNELMEELLTPFSEEFPSGEYLKDNKLLYRSLRNTYNIAYNSFQQLLLNPIPEEQAALISTNKKNWQVLEAEIIGILREHSRDIECLIWLSMAQLFSDEPYKQFTKGLLLIIRCMEIYGKNIQPYLPDEKLQSNNPEESAIERAQLHSQSFALLLGESNDSCLLAPFFKILPLIGDINYIAYWHQKKPHGEEDDDEGEEEEKNLQQIAAHYASNHQNEVMDRIDSFNTLLSTLEGLKVTLCEYFQPFGIEEPATLFLEEAIKANLHALDDLIKDAIILPADNQEIIAPTENEGKQTTQSITTKIPSTTHWSGRDEAFQQLKNLSSYFRETEPQSPVSYLLEKALRWGYTPLPKLLGECVGHDEGTFEQLSTLFGINTDEEDN